MLSTSASPLAVVLSLCLLYASLIQAALRFFPMGTAMLFIMRLLEIMFFVGLAGSAIVVLISFIDDLKELIHPDN